MKSRNILIFVLLLLAGCEFGPLDTGGTRLVEAKYEGKYGDNWSEKFMYDRKGNLVEIIDRRSGGQRVKIDYAEGRVIQYTTYLLSQDEVIFRDSIGYNPHGLIDKIYSYSRNAGPDLPLNWIREFEYDSLGVLLSKRSNILPSQEVNRLERYYWKGANVERMEFYEDEELRYEYFYTYDDKVNFRKGDPRFLAEPISWSENNITATNWIDYYGNLDLICRPCVNEYLYNLDDRPISITTNWGQKTILRYGL